jgi:hypothetical protein
MRLITKHEFKRMRLKHISQYTETNFLSRILIHILILRKINTLNQKAIFFSYLFFTILFLDFEFSVSAVFPKFRFRVFNFRRLAKKWWKKKYLTSNTINVKYRSIDVNVTPKILLLYVQ